GVPGQLPAVPRPVRTVFAAVDLAAHQWAAADVARRAASRVRGPTADVGRCRACRNPRRTAVRADPDDAAAARSYRTNPLLLLVARTDAGRDGCRDVDTRACLGAEPDERLGR